MCKTESRIAVVGLLGLLVVLAAAMTATAETERPQRVIVIEDDGAQHTITLDGSSLEFLSQEDGGETVVAFDLAALGPVIDEAVAGALAGLDGALAALDDIDVQVEGDVLVIRQGDDLTRVDLDDLGRRVDIAMQEVRRDLQREGIVIGGLSDHDDATADLRAEIAALQEELARLRADLEARDD